MKLTTEQVVALRERSAAGEGNASLAAFFGICERYVSELARGKRRRDEGGPLREPRGVGCPKGRTR